MKKFIEEKHDLLAGILAAMALIAIVCEVAFGGFAKESIVGGIKDISGVLIDVLVLLIAASAFIRKPVNFKAKFNAAMDGIKEKYNPNGFAFGDFELVQDFEGDKAYLIYERPHSEMVVTPLSEDYLSVEEDNYKTFFHNGRPPYIREAPATFVYKGKIYMITSGTTGKFPNPSEIAVAYMGEWKVLGDPFINDIKRTSFDSQISCIFKHPKHDNLYIAMADRWLVDLPEDLPDMQKLLDRVFDDTKEPVPFDERTYTKKNTSIAEYVWLPIEFIDGQPIIRWYDEWWWECISNK